MDRTKVPSPPPPPELEDGPPAIGGGGRGSSIEELERMLSEEHGHRDHIAKGARETAQVLRDTMAAVTAEGETVNQDLKSAMQLAEERMKALKKHEDDVRSWSEAAGKKARDDAESIASRAAQRAKEVEKSAGVQAAKTLAEAKDQPEDCWRPYKCKVKSWNNWNP